MDINPRHFSLLRLARLRQLRVRRISRSLWAVSSYSNHGHWYTVTSDVCQCPSVGYCTHRALALDTQVRLEAEPPEYLRYMNAQREDFAALELRVLHGEETSEDKAFVKPLIEQVRQRQEPYVMRERAEVSF